MNRRTLERHLRQHGCRFHHHGARHDYWENITTLALAPVPRHTTVRRGTVRSICRQLGVPLPPGF
jgi:hypothetical protein